MRRFLRDFPEKHLAILSVDPTRQRTGGALLGDRIRMNAIDSPRVFMRSLATRRSHTELSAAIEDALAVLKAAAFDLIIVETSGIGQGDAGIVESLRRLSLRDDQRVRRPDPAGKNRHARFCRPVALNKMEKKGAEDALRNVRKQVPPQPQALRGARRGRSPSTAPSPASSTTPATNVLYRALIDAVNEKKGTRLAIIPGDR